MSSPGKMEMPVGASVVPEPSRDRPDGRVSAASQYRRAEDAALARAEERVVAEVAEASATASP